MVPTRDREDSAQFGIVQGGTFHELRAKSAELTVSIGFEGYAIGGLSVGEPNEVMYEVVETTTPLLPANQPRYLMGVGTPIDLIECVARGIDMFDCVMPTRNARNGQLFTSEGPRKHQERAVCRRRRARSIRPVPATPAATFRGPICSHLYQGRGNDRSHP